MAEAYAKKRFIEEGLDIEVRSAGILGVNGLFPTEETIKVLEEEKVPSDGYSSTELTEQLISWADLILVMEPRHLAGISRVEEKATSKTMYLKQFAGEEESINDPIGRSLDVYRETLNVIKCSIEGLIRKIKEDENE